VIGWLNTAKKNQEGEKGRLWMHTAQPHPGEGPSNAAGQQEKNGCTNVTTYGGSDVM
jgi:hypothetical protein